MAKIDLESEDLLFYAETGSDYFYVTYDPQYYKIHTYRKPMFETLVFKNEKGRILFDFIDYFVDDTRKVFEIPKIKVDKFNFSYDLNYVMKSVDKYFGSWWDQSNFSIERDAVGYLGFVIGSELEKTLDSKKVVAKFSNIAEKVIQWAKDNYKSLNEEDLIEIIEYLIEDYPKKLSEEEKNMLIEHILDNYYHTSFDPYLIIEDFESGKLGIDVPLF